MNEADYLLRRFALALCIYREASGEPHEGKVWVGQTIENRVVDHRWPDTYIKVITQPLQFSSFNRNDPNNSRWPSENDTAWAECVAAADEIIASQTVFTTANHYHVTGLTPPWADPAKVVGVKGHHTFYTL